MAREARYTAQLVHVDTQDVKERVAIIKDALKVSEAAVLRQIVGIALPLVELATLTPSARVHGARGVEARERRIETMTEEIRVELINQMLARHPRREPSAAKAAKNGKPVTKTTPKKRAPRKVKPEPAEALATTAETVVEEV